MRQANGTPDETQHIDSQRLARLLHGGAAVLYACRPDGDFAVTFISPNVQRLFGWRPQDFTAAPDFWLRHIHPDDRGHVEACLARLAHEDQLSYEYRFRHADGRWLWVVDQAVVWRGADGQAEEITGSLADVTDARVMENALREALTFEQALIDALPIPVFYNVPDGRYLAVNKAFEEAFGVRRESILGRTNFDFLRHDYAEAIAAWDRALLAADGRQTYECRMGLKDGAEHDLLVHKAVFHDGAGRLRGWVGSLVDISETRRTEEKLLQTAKLATLGQIASEVAHELNQPLSILRMTLDDLQDRLAVPTALAAALRQVERMAEIVNHLRVYSRAEQPEARPFPVIETVVNAARLMVPQLDGDGIALRLDIPDGPALVLGQASHFEQVMLNLLANARDAVRGRPDPGRPGWIAVRVRLAAAERSLRIEVEDNGGGVPEVLWPRIFDPFFTTKPEGQGTGLGLSISSDILHRLGGRLSGENTGTGARFTLAVPLLSLQPDVAAAPLPAEAAQPLRPGRHILVVDDEREALQVMADYLRRRGHSVAVAADGQEALRQFALQPCDVLVSDLRMPHLSGSDLARRLRQQRPGLPVVLMTGQVEVGAVDCESCVLLRKPISLKELQQVIQQL